MDAKDKKAEKWHGQEVQRGPSEDAEEAASRAEGKRPILVTDAGQEPPHEAAPAPRRAANPDDKPEDKIEDAAEEHRARRAKEAGVQRGKL